MLTNTDNANDPREFGVLREILLDGSAVSQAGSKFDADARRSIWVQFTESGARRFEEITASNIDPQIAIVYHGAVLTAPFIRTKIPGGQISIPGPQSLKEVSAHSPHLVRRGRAIVSAYPPAGEWNSASAWAGDPTRMRPIPHSLMLTIPHSLM
ncbi:MAG TPA: hypothetical protein VFE51_21090 [Verrucomicrobiae bacterium]|nr:hypothetical protein [Verrucomicrobiae bacterium]